MPVAAAQPTPTGMPVPVWQQAALPGQYWPSVTQDGGDGSHAAASTVAASPVDASGVAVAPSGVASVVPEASGDASPAVPASAVAPPPLPLLPHAPSVAASDPAAIAESPARAPTFENIRFKKAPFLSSLPGPGGR